MTSGVASTSPAARPGHGLPSERAGIPLSIKASYRSNLACAAPVYF